MFSLETKNVVNFQDQPEMANGTLSSAPNHLEETLWNLLQLKMNTFQSKEFKYLEQTGLLEKLLGDQLELLQSKWLDQTLLNQAHMVETDSQLGTRLLENSLILTEVLECGGWSNSEHHGFIKLWSETELTAVETDWDLPMFSLVAHYVAKLQDQPEMANGTQLHAKDQSEAAMSNL